MVLPPASSSCRPSPSSWFFTRDGSAPGMSHFVSATMIGHSAALACAIASSVCMSTRHVNLQNTASSGTVLVTACFVKALITC